MGVRDYGDVGARCAELSSRSPTTRFKLTEEFFESDQIDHFNSYPLGKLSRLRREARRSHQDSLHRPFRSNRSVELPHYCGSD